VIVTFGLPSVFQSAVLTDAKSVQPFDATADQRVHAESPAGTRPRSTYASEVLRSNSVLCTPHCAAAGGANADMYAMSGIVGLIFGNSLLALIVAVALGVLTLVVELSLAGGRTTRRLRTSGTGLGGCGQPPGSA